MKHLKGIMDNTKLKLYAELKGKVKALEDELKALQPEILADLKERTKELADKSIRFEFGTFSITERKTWEYTEMLMEKEKELKESKKAEELAGIAKVTVTESVRYQ